MGSFDSHTGAPTTDGANAADASQRQLTRWAGYGLPRLIGGSAAGSVLLALVQFLLANVFKWHDAASNAVMFGLTLFVTSCALALWTRHQARHGRRTRWLGNPGK
jgi:hypothetical protein